MYCNCIDEMYACLKMSIQDMTEITKWSDVNYWALKHSTEKSHKTLHKLARKYEANLILWFNCNQAE